MILSHNSDFYLTIIIYQYQTMILFINLFFSAIIFSMQQTNLFPARATETKQDDRD